MESPKIRFKGYTDDWEERKLGKLGSLKNGMNFSKDAMGHGYAFVNLQNIFGNNVVDVKNLGLAEASEKQLLEYSLQKGDVLFVRSSVKLEGVGEAALVAETLENTTYSGFIIRFRDEYGLNNDFKKFVFATKKVRDQIMSQATNSANKNISQSALENLTFEIPSKDEQKQIGEYFSNLDHLITLHQRKCDELKKVKKFMLQNLFPKNGEKYPAIRFEGFTDAWEQRKLIEVCDYVDYRGKTPAKTESGIFLVTAKNVKDGYIDYKSSQEYISEEDYEEVMHRGKPEIGDVLITTEAPCGNVAQVNVANIALAQRIIKYRGHENVVDNTYLKYYLLSPVFQKVLNEKSSGGTVKGIKGSILHQQYIQYPTHDEQVKIGAYFAHLDNLLTLHQRKCDEIKEVKKFMLQNMFV